MIDLMRPVSRLFPWLSFKLVTKCLDDNSVDSYRLSRGTAQKWTVPEKRQQAHWQSASKKFRLYGDSLYEDDHARHYAEERILIEALDHWERHELPANPRQRPRRRQWWNQVPQRDLATERELALLTVSEKPMSQTHVKHKRDGDQKRR
jgi:hypothetical protein